MWNIFVALSILLGSIIFGSYKMTLSASLGEIESESWLAHQVCNTLELILDDPDHCYLEYIDYLEEQRKLNE